MLLKYIRSGSTPLSPRTQQTLRLNPEVTSIDGFKPEDFELTGYEPHKKISMVMAV